MQCSVVQCSAVKCSAVQCSAVQCSAVQCSAVQCSAVQYSAVQCSAVQCTSPVSVLSFEYTRSSSRLVLPNMAESKNPPNNVKKSFAKKICLVLLPTQFGQDQDTGLWVFFLFHTKG